MLRFGDSSSRARRWVSTQGLSLTEATPTDNIPTLPADITAEPDGELMALFIEVNSWLDYVETAVAAAQIDLKQLELDLEILHAKEMIKHKATERNVSAAKAQAYSNPLYTDLRDQVHLQYGRAKLLETVYNSLDRKKFIISREISRRSYAQST